MLVHAGGYDYIVILRDLSHGREVMAAYRDWLWFLVLGVSLWLWVASCHLICEHIGVEKASLLGS